MIIERNIVHMLNINQKNTGESAVFTAIFGILLIVTSAIIPGVASARVQVDDSKMAPIYTNLELVTQSMPQGQVGTPYSTTFQVTGGVAPYFWSVSSENGAGSVKINSVTGDFYVSTPKIGNWKVTVSVKDSAGNYTSKLYTWVVKGNQIVPAHAEGSLVLGLFNIPSSVSLIENGKLRVFPTGEVFISHGYKWQNIVPANSGDKQLAQGQGFTFASGTLIRDSRNLRNFYVVYPNNIIRGFSSDAVFQSMGYRYDMAYTTSIKNYKKGTALTALDNHANGTDIYIGQTIYRLENNTLRPYPSMAVYNTWRTEDSDTSKLVPATLYEGFLPIGPAMQPRF